MKMELIKMCLIPMRSWFPAAGNAFRSSNKEIIIFSLLNIAVLFLLILFFRMFKKMKKENRESKFFDEQTKLFNRNGFILRFKYDISDFSRTNYHLAYFMVDSNRLQTYHNDIEFSDVISHMAKVLTENTKNYEFAARITESGFAMALYEDDEIVATKRVIKIMDEFSALTDVNGKPMDEVFKSSLYRLEENDHNCEILFFNLRRNCNSILGESKSYVYCDSEDMNNVQVEKQKAEEIRNALKRGEFKLYIQFIVDNKTKKIVSGEALSRWENPYTGIQLPGAYLGTMMNSGIITEFDYYMFEKVCQQLHQWKSTSLKELALSCNFTRITISEKDFVEKILNISEKYDFDRKNLIMEITEETLEKNRETALNNMRECKKLGFRIALDDFCSGFTSPLNLCEYPIDIVKIDREILLNIQHKKGKDLFKGLVALGHSLELKIVCEGVETENQYDYVNSTPCDYIQGWYFSKAIPARKSEDFVRNFSG